MRITMCWLFYLLLILNWLMLGPTLMLFSNQIDLNLDWRTADRSSTGLAPAPATHPEAIVQLYSARTYRWRGMFAVHTWLAVKPAHAKQYTVYEILDWNKFNNRPFLTVYEGAADDKWFGYTPTLLYQLDGPEAAKAIPAIEAAVKAYPYKQEYVLWPGPNSNTFIATIVRETPQLKVALPNTAIGKDFLPNDQFFARAPSKTGYQLSFDGLIGITLALKEGIEFNLLGMDFGINLQPLGFKLPGLGLLPL